MRWIRRDRRIPLQSPMIPRLSGRSAPTWLVVSLAVPMIVLGAVLLLAGSPEEKIASIYSTAANYSLPVMERDRFDYVGLLEVLEPLGTVSAKTEGAHWRFRYNNVESEFIAGQKRARVRGVEVDLPANFLLENGRGLVPLSSLSSLLSRFLGGQVTYHENARRLFIGNVEVHFTAQVSTANAPKLVMKFSSPVNPMIATEPGKLRMVFKHEPLVAPGSTTLTFDSKAIPSATFQENNGEAELVVVGSVPLLASFGDDGRTITIEPPPASPAQAQNTPAVPAAASAPPADVNAPAPSARHYFVVVDPSHGGDETGATLSDQVVEKDVTLAFGRWLRQELEGRGLPALLLREGDLTLSLDQRASMTNAAHPAIYICVHASSQGNGVRLYTALISAAGENHGPFLDWNSAQSSFEGLSKTAETDLSTQLKNKQIPSRTLMAPLRPLNNITAPALAIEVAPINGDVAQFNSSAYQQSIAAAIAAGVADLRTRLEARQ